MLPPIIIVGIAFVLSFALACGLGANDVSNAFATSIGAGVVTLTTAFIIASIAEVVGSVALGGLVTEKIIQATLIPGILTPEEMMYAMLASLLSVALWLALATYLKLPVSATHAVISAMIGAGMMANSSAVCWSLLSHMALAWVIAPVLSGILSSLVYVLLKKFILIRKDPFGTGLKSIPYIYALTIGVNASMIGYQLYGRLSLSLPIAILLIGTIFLLVTLTLLIARFVVVPWTQFVINSRRQSTTKDISQPSFSPEDVEQLFSVLQVLSAIFTSFAHGSNDVSNSVGPLFGLLNAYLAANGRPIMTSDSPALYGLLAFGGIGMIVGLFTWGARVIETLGTKLTASISPSKGFSIELGSAITVLGASIAGLSVSTTHCKVGAIVALGFNQDHHHQPTATTIVSSFPSTKASTSSTPVNWRLIGDIFASWICTIPFAGFLSAGCYYSLSTFSP